MLNLLYPKEYLSSYKELTPEKILSLNARWVIFDIDNTLVPYFIKEPTVEIAAYFKELKKAGIKPAVLSNSRKERSEVFCRELDIPFVYRAKKPLSQGLKKLIKKLGADPAKSIVIGDQIFTDVLMGNLNGIYSVLVKKIDKKDELITAVKRPFEKIILFFYLRSLKK